MRIQTAKGPKGAVGGMWEEIGKLQFDFLLKQGLKPNHKLLDFGCGCLRGGIHFIRYLNEGNYYGIDINADILEAGRTFLSEAGLEHKRPLLIINKDSKFDDFHGEVFDFILAQSVFTDIPLSDIEGCFENINKVMDNKTVFLATFNDGGDKCFIKNNYLAFYYPFDTLRDIGEKNGYEVIFVEDFVHPRKQGMMRITLR